MISTIYRKELRKNLVMGLLPSAIMGGFALLMALIWPEFKDQAAQMEELMEA